ncbi:lytic transglycosylase domain-containing protein [Arthrobacter woluwensis]|uniref:lytic transglycosylase domain-containing protein n=1 Tax=Arthrobacter woluwensis TaxID=156980 RepID=UPI0021BDA62C|nr:lytic murein transglycosylase [Arthrobacter woluwensis]
MTTPRRSHLVTGLAVLVLLAGTGWGVHTMSGSRASGSEPPQTVDAADTALAALRGGGRQPVTAETGRPLWQSEIDHAAGWSAAPAPAPGKITAMSEESTPRPAAATDTGTGADPQAATGPDSGGLGEDTAGIDRRWLLRTAQRTGIPARALQSYAGAAVRSERSVPGCGIGWNTLAGIGYIESRHGTHGGHRVQPDGQVSGPILGPALDGNGYAMIRDTDGGTLDGDTRWDRAVGPFQFIPSTWARYASRAAGDGAAASPHNMDDAALTAARYLCAAGGDLGTAAGWTRAVFAYNHSQAYVDEVMAAANAYAKRAGEP